MVERTMCAKNLPVGSFLRHFFSKKWQKPLTNSNSQTAFSFDTASAKEKANKKKTRKKGALPQTPFAFLEKSEAKNYPLGAVRT